MTEDEIPGPTVKTQPAVAPEPAPLAAPTAPVWPRVGAVLSGALDLVTRSRIQIRDGSLYIGLLGLLTIGPALLALLAQGEALRNPDLAGVSGLAVLGAIPALLAFLAISLEAQILAIAILGGARAGRPLTLREALRRSRAIFWRYFRASVAVGLLTVIVQAIVSALFDGVFGHTTDAAPVGTSIAVGVVMAPLVYVETGVILGDVGAVEAIRRSVRLARARLRLAVLASVFAVASQYLLIFAAFAGLDIVIRVLEPFRGELERLDATSATGFLVVGVVVLALLTAFFSLTFTIGALATSPQVVAFLGLTGYSAGLDGARDPPDGQPAREVPAWVSRPMRLGIAIAGVSAVLAIASGLGSGG